VTTAGLARANTPITILRCLPSRSNEASILLIRYACHSNSHLAGLASHIEHDVGTEYCSFWLEVTRCRFRRF
jgi:hypothetical protein